jgi:UDP-N-acetylglucosamine diphosphorylase/glucosamine-1-phosphate N-acetyltransferase
MTDLRASFEVRSGMLTTAGRLAAQHPRRLAGYWVPPRLEALLRERADAPVNELPRDETILCANGRWALPVPDLDLEAGEALVEADTEHVVAAVLRRADAQYFLKTGQLHELAVTRRHEGRLLYRYPWDVIALMKQTIPDDIAATRLVGAQVIDERSDVIGDHPVEVHASATVHPQVVLDASQGSIIVHERAVIRPGVILCGPCSVGPGATIVDRALIRPFTVVGASCKVGGEVGATIFQGWSNKAHDGYLGDSWVGKWVNIGAGATSSNLLNTYGEVSLRIDPDGPMHRTGLQFLGAIIGDHVKLAIGTRLMTGSVIGTGAMIATTAAPPTCVRRFAWLTDRGEQVFRFGRFLETATAMMARRERTPSEAYVAAMRELHESATRRAAPLAEG